MGVRMTIDVRDAQAKLEGFERRARRLRPAMQVVAQIIRSSVLENFRVGGRPRWKPLSPVTLARRRGKKKHTILVDTGRLRASIAGGAESVHEVGDTYARVGTNVIYAAVHQFGAKKGAFGTKKVRVREHYRRIGRKRVLVREHLRTVKIPWGDIPARPFLVVQEEDLRDITEVIREHLLR